MSDPRYRAEFVTPGDEHWATNAVRYDTEDEARDYGRGLADRWTAVTDWRVVPDNTPERQPYENDGEWSR